MTRAVHLLHKDISLAAPVQDPCDSEQTSPDEDIAPDPDYRCALVEIMKWVASLQQLTFLLFWLAKWKDKRDVVCICTRRINWPCDLQLQRQGNYQN
jgi:hypothetical protein